MKRKQLFLALGIVGIVAMTGLWLGRDASRSTPSDSRGAESATADPATSSRAAGPGRGDAGMGTPDVPPRPDRMLRPPDPARRFLDFTPEQRVDFARRGHGPGG